MRGQRGWASRMAAVVVLPLAVVLLPARQAPAQEAPRVESTAPPDADVPRPRRRHASRLYFGMWTTHLNQDVVALDNNWVLGVSHRGFFGATFLNSFGRRAFAGGLQRTIVGTGDRALGGSLGYRLGFITGYDGRLIRLARDTPVLPLVQPYATLEIYRIGVEVSYTFVVVSVAMSYRF